LIQRNFKAWRKEKIERDKYIEKKRKLREVLEVKQKEKKEKEEKELMNLRKEMEV